MGPITPVKFAEINVKQKEKFAIGELTENCGLKEPCKQNEFPVHLYTGKDDKDEPKVCVNGK